MAVSLLVCAIVAIVYSESISPFTISSLILFLISMPILRRTKNVVNNTTVNRREAYLTVTLSWFIIGLSGAIPYLISRAIPSFVDAVFESISGFTTTGSSILTDIESLPKSILFWRSMTHWIGGIGIIVLVIVIMPSLQIGSYHLFSMESSLQEKIQARIKSVGHRLLIIYLILTVAEIVLLMLGHMNFYESTCHAFGTVATGGFSPKNTSIAGYSPYIQYVIMLFMVLAGTNFAVHYYVYKRKYQKIKGNEEVRFYLLVILALGLIISGILFVKMNLPLEQAFRDGFFQVISIVTCTGFATADYMVWPRYAWFILFLAMFLGGSTGSTAGGIKMVRHMILLKNIRRTFRLMVWPNAIIPVKLDHSAVSDESNSNIISFIMAYLLIFVAGTIVLILMGVNLNEASSSVATCMAGIGPGLGKVGPAGNFAHLSESVKLLLSFLMIVGRLEIYTVLIIFTRNFWKS